MKQNMNKCFIFVIDPFFLPDYVSVEESGNATVIVMDSDSKLFSNNLSQCMHMSKHKSVVT